VLSRQLGKIAAGGDLLFDFFALFFVFDEDMPGRCDSHGVFSKWVWKIAWTRSRARRQLATKRWPSA
jgi:hypothetical protein